jgi:hypothetical protein
VRSGAAAPGASGAGGGALRGGWAALAMLAAGCAGGPGAGGARAAGAPDHTSDRAERLAPVAGRAGWVSARKQLGALRARLVPGGPRGYRITATFHEGRSGRAFSARGAYAVRPPDALRMQLVGPAGALALDVWASGDEARLAVPALGRVERFHQGTEPPGRPTGFLRWWALHPLDGALLMAYGNTQGRVGRFLLRAPDGALIDARVRPDGALDVLRATQADRERVVAEGAPCGGARYESQAARLRVEVRCEGLAPPPSERAFVDPDAPPGGAP